MTGFYMKCITRLHWVKTLTESYHRPQAYNFIKKRLQHRCFPVKFAEFQRIYFFTEHLQRLPLKLPKWFT